MSSLPNSNIRPCSTKTALVVSRNPQIAAIMADILPDWIIVRAFANRIALTLIEAGSFDLVLTAENASGMVDVALLRKIRLARPHTRLIVLIDENTPADVISALREGGFSLFSKPPSLTLFAETVQLAAEGPCWDDGIEVLSATPAGIQLAARCDPQTADRLLQFLHEIGDLRARERVEVAAAFREMLLSAIGPVTQFDSDRYVGISYLRARHIIVGRLKRLGEGLSLAESRYAAIANPVDHAVLQQASRDGQRLMEARFGLLITRGLIDELLYDEKSDDVLLVKYLDSARRQSA
jgi:DNA-binding NarL/FixJ family response regulator